MLEQLTVLLMNAGTKLQGSTPSHDALLRDPSEAADDVFRRAGRLTASVRGALGLRGGRCPGHRFFFFFFRVGVCGCAGV